MEEKRTLRSAVREAREARAARVPRAARDADAAAHDDAAALTAQLARLTQELGASRVTCFVSVKGEPDTAGYLAWALEHGVEVLLPRVLPGGRLEWAAHAAGAFTPGAFGIPEPTGPAIPDGPANCELLLIPAAAVDRAGTRLGWGRGYFDRELSRLPAAGGASGSSVFAVVWEDEVYEHLPAEAHDVPVLGAVTEERIHRFG